LRWEGEVRLLVRQGGDPPGAPGFEVQNWQGLIGQVGGSLLFVLARKPD